MTTITYRSGVMAADSRAYAGRGNPTPGAKVKVRRMDDGTLIGCSSSTVGGTEFVLNWYEKGADPKDLPAEKPDNFEFLAVKPDGALYVGIDAFHLSGPIDSEFYAVGSGSNYAMGAMGMGADAEQAVEVAARFDPFTGGPITVLRR